MARIITIASTVDATFSAGNMKPRKRDRSYFEDWPSETSLHSRSGRENQRRHTFIESLNENVPDHLRLATARRIVNFFPNRREEAARQLYRYFNNTVFNLKLPKDVDLTWNNRFLRTAGQCVLQMKGGKRTVTIELSKKVCDSAERLRDTIVHEMCHAAVWVINGEEQGHGPLWRQWAARANERLPDLPPITRSHSYRVATKYLYVCTDCDVSVGRHSRSLDKSKCPQCGGRYERRRQPKSGTLKPVPSAHSVRNSRAINRFTIFVKTHYPVVKMRERGLGHGQVMKILSMEYAKAKQSAPDSGKEVTRLKPITIYTAVRREEEASCKLFYKLRGSRSACSVSVGWFKGYQRSPTSVFTCRQK